MSEGTRVRLRAFVGRSFLPEDESLWQEVRKILDCLKPIGFWWEDASEASDRAISEKARTGIENNDIYVGIVSRRFPLRERSGLRRMTAALQRPTSWSAPPWVIQESGYALGKDKRVLLLIEEGVDFPSSNIDADREWIGIRRGSVDKCTDRIVAAINHMIAEKLPAPPATLEIAPLPEPPRAEQRVVGSEEGPSFDKITELVEESQFSDADAAFEAFVTAYPRLAALPWLRLHYLRIKAVAGDTRSRDELMALVEREPGNIWARTELADYYSEFNSHAEASELLLKGVDFVGKQERAGLLRAAAEKLAAGGRMESAVEILSSFLREPEQDARERRLAFISVADLAGRMKDRDLAVCGKTVVPQSIM